MAENSEHAKAHQAVGAYICAYSDASHELGETLKALFRIKENEMADAIVAALGDFARQASLVGAICEYARNAKGSELSKEQKQTIERTIKRIFSCNDDRVKLAHGRLQPKSNGSIELVHTKVVQGKLKKVGETWSQADFNIKTENLKKLAEELRGFQNELQRITIKLPEGAAIDWTTNYANILYQRPLSPAVIDMLTKPKRTLRPPPDKAG
jgi:hypothetical protein